MHVWALGLSCEAPATPKPPGLHTTTRELQTCTFEGPGLQKTPPKLNETPERDKKSENGDGRGKKERNFGRSGVGRSGVGWSSARGYSATWSGARGEPEGPTPTPNTNTQQQQHITQQHITKKDWPKMDWPKLAAKWAGPKWIGPNWIGQRRPLPCGRPPWVPDVQCGWQILLQCAGPVVTTS